MDRVLWLMVTSEDGQHKAFNFLKLIKPPDGTDMTDQVVKLDWNKDTAAKWEVNDAKTSMEAAGFDWVKRDNGQPLSENNFKVLFAVDQTWDLNYGKQIESTAGETVQYFELLEQWMGPAIPVRGDHVFREGVNYEEFRPGSLYEKFPEDGVGATFNTLTWVNVLASPPISDSDYWWRTTIQKVKDTAATSNKVSQNGNADSIWYRWTNVEDPDLGTDEIWLFEERASGELFPENLRVRFAR